MSLHELHEQRAARLRRMQASGKPSSELEILPRHLFARSKAPPRPSPPATPPVRTTRDRWREVFERAAQIPIPQLSTETEEDFQLDEPPTLRSIIDATAQYYGISRYSLVGVGRTKRIIRPRHVAYYLARALTRRSLFQIGSMLHRDHSTILHGVHKITEQLQVDESLAVDVEAIRKIILEKA